MKKHISIILTAVLILTAVMGLGSVALADGVTLTLDPNSVEASAGETISIDASVYNGSGTLISPEFYIAQDGTRLHTFEGGLGIEDQASTSFNFTITQAMIDSGSATFNVYNAGDTLIGSANLSIDEYVPVTDLHATCKADQTIVNAGDIITFTYELENLGETTLSNIVLKAEGLGSGALNNEPLTLAPGETTKFTYDHTVTAITTIKPYIEYAADGVPQERKNLDPIELTSEERLVEPMLSVNNPNPEPGEEVTFTLTIKNEGTVPYTDLTVTYGAKNMGFSTSRLNPGDEPSEEYTMSFTESTDVQFLITLEDHEGETVSVNSNTVKIQLPVDPQALQEKISLVITPDVSQLTSAGTVNFTGYIANNSEYMLSDVSVTEPTLGNIPGVSDVMDANSRRNLNFSADIAETTTYHFLLTVHDRNGDEYTVEADPITVTIASAAVTTPGYDDAADVDGEELTLEPNSGSVGKLGVFAILAIVLVVLILGVGVALLVLWKKGQRPKKRPVSPGRKTKSVKRPPPRNYRDRNNF